MTTEDMHRVPDGAEVSFVDRLGAGGQGEVWRVEVAGEVHAAKVYFADNATDNQRRTIERLVRQPTTSPHFLWPSALIESDDDDGTFGYLMPLRQPRFRGLVDIVAARVSVSFDAILTAGINLANAFRDLHTRGLAYRDINLNNVFIDPTTGDIAICDTDNVGIDVLDPGGVLGTSGFMAPEIERGVAVPSAATDRHSLAVLLFMMLVRHHPLEGARSHVVKCLDVPARRRLYGEEPLYIFDPKDTSNQPTPLQTNPTLYRGIYPAILWQTFERAFTRGLDEPGQRVTETGWERALRATRDLLVRCGCGARRFVEPHVTRACWRCGDAGAGRLFLRIKRGGAEGAAVVAVDAGKVLDAGHVAQGGGGAAASGNGGRVATFVAHPDDAQVVGLRNDGADAWTVVPETGGMMPVAPGKAARCAAGVRVQLGSGAGVFELG